MYASKAIVREAHISCAACAQVLCPGLMLFHQGRVSTKSYPPEPLIVVSISI